MKLAEIDAPALACATVVALINRVRGLAESGYPCLEVIEHSKDASYESTQLGRAVRKLVMYACHGSSREWLTSLDVDESLMLVTTLGILAEDGLEPLGDVCSAVKARRAIEREEYVSPFGLAVLAGIETAQIRRLTTNERVSKAHPLKRKGHGQITHESARAWLKSRGVAGL